MFNHNPVMEFYERERVVDVNVEEEE